MKLEEYMRYLQTVVKHFPEALEYEVVYTNAERSEFVPMYYNPTIGKFQDGEFIDGEDVLEPNAVCIN